MWRVTPGQALACRQWDDDLVLFNSLSGSTHLLGPGAAVLLDCLRPGPASEAALAGALVEHFDIEPDELPSTLAGLLAELSRLDLIQPCPPSPA